MKIGCTLVMCFEVGEGQRFSSHEAWTLDQKKWEILTYICWTVRNHVDSRPWSGCIDLADSVMYSVLMVTESGSFKSFCAVRREVIGLGPLEDVKSEYGTVAPAPPLAFLGKIWVQNASARSIIHTGCIFWGSHIPLTRDDRLKHFYRCCGFDFLVNSWFI